MRLLKVKIDLINYNCLVFLILELDGMRSVGVVYFIYLFLYSGLEFTLTFLTHNRFDFNR